METSGQQKKKAEGKKDPSVPWRNSVAKQLLRQDILDGVVPLRDDEMPDDLIYWTRREYQEYGLSRFKGYLKSLRNTITKEREKEAYIEEWKYSEAKELLTKDLLDGTFPLNNDGSDAVSVYRYRPQYLKYEFDKFQRYLKSLRLLLSNKKAWAARDAVALAHDRKIHPIQTHNHKGVPRWEGSDAQRFLVQDIKSGKYKEFETTEALYASREAFHEYTMSYFRKKVCQTVRTCKFVAYYEDKKKHKKKGSSKDSNGGEKNETGKVFL